MIKSDGKNQRHDEEHDECALVSRAQNYQTKETDQQNRKLRRDHVCQDCAHKKAVFALEERHAGRTVMPDFEWLRGDFSLATHRTEQSQTTTYYPLDLWPIFFHRVRTFYSARKITTSRTATKTANRTFLTVPRWIG